ncbi:type I-E CRISPR-associated protein Cas6/Cse3/CasE [Streptomyces spiramenti]|uniref:type I-E CRISPR-associated protein Cas6/Cse3/CasE n=1 Tax=Streptomyces spiramenti TaxID=2720606 RepID=UPI003B8362F6
MPRCSGSGDRPPRRLRIATRCPPRGGQTSAVTFEGHLRITDPAHFTMRLLNGIGPQKAYG